MSAIFWTITQHYTGIAQIFTNPVDGIIKTTTAIPRGRSHADPVMCCVDFNPISGIMNIVSAVHEGFHNVPKLYGSDVREPGKVTDFGSGMKEAGKASFKRFAVSDRN